MKDTIFSNFNLVDLLNDFFVFIVIYLLAALISVFLKRNKEFMTPVIYGLMYGSYMGLIYSMKLS